MKHQRTRFLLLLCAVVLLLCLSVLTACGNKQSDSRVECNDGEHQWEADPKQTGFLLCKKCGKSEKCPHETTVWEAYDGTWHIKKCTLCGKNLADGIGTMSEETIESTYVRPGLAGKHDGDPCTVCGYTRNHDETFYYLESYQPSSDKNAEQESVRVWRISGLVSTAEREELVLPDTYRGEKVIGYTPAFIRDVNTAVIRILTFNRNNMSWYNNEDENGSFTVVPSDRFTTVMELRLADNDDLKFMLKRNILSVFSEMQLGVAVDGAFLTEIHADATWVSSDNLSSLNLTKIFGLTSVTLDGTGLEKCSVFGGDSIKSLTIGEGVKSLGYIELPGMTSIRLPESLTSISSSSFRGCDSLERIDLPAGVTEIPDYAFAYCDSLREFTVGETVTGVGENAFYQCYSLNRVRFLNENTTIGKSCFADCTSLFDVELPAKLRALPDSVFSNNHLLVTIDLPDTLETIGSSVFYKCSALRRIVLPASLTSIGGVSNVFYYCASLETVYNLSSVDLGEISLTGHPSSYRVPVKTELPDPAYDPVVEMDENRFLFYTPSATSTTHWLVGYAGKKPGMTEMTLPYAYHTTERYTVADYAFCYGYDGTILNRFVIPDGVQIVGTHTFNEFGNFTREIICLAGNAMLEDLKSNDSSRNHGLSDVRYFFTSFNDAGEWTKEENDCLFYIEKDGTAVLYTAPRSEYEKGKYTYLLPDDFRGGTYVIGSYALDENMHKLTIPAKVTELRKSACAFSPTYGGDLSELTFLGTGIRIGKNAFYNRTDSDGYLLRDFVIPDGAVLDDNALVGLDITGTLTIGKNVVFGKNSLSAYLITGVIVGKGTDLGTGTFNSCRQLVSVTLPEGLTEIGDDTFRYCDNLQSLTIPDSVERIGNHAFDGTAISSLTLPASLRSIEESAFERTSLTSITLPEGLLSIGDRAFYNLALTSVTFPSTLRTIGAGAFESTRLTSLVLPEGLESIGQNAFYGIATLTDEILLPESLTVVGEDAFGGDRYGTYPDEAMNRLVYTYLETLPEGFSTACAKNFSYGGKPATVGDFTFVLAKTGATLTGYTGNDTVLTIPTVCDGKAVNAIRAGAFDSLSSVTEMTVPATVTAFPEKLFDRCTSLTTFLYDGDAELTYEMFRNTQYHGTKDGAYIYLGKVVTGFSPDAGKVAKMREGTTRILDGVLSATGDVRILIIPASVTDFGKNNFAAYTDEMEIYVQGQSSTDFNTGNAYYYASVTVTDDGLIFQQNNLSGSDNNIALIRYIGTATEVSVPATINDKAVTYIGASRYGAGVGAFRWCETLTKVSFSSVTLEFSGGSFDGCTALRTLDFGSNLAMLTMAPAAIAGSAIDSIVTPQGYVTVWESIPMGSNAITKTAGDGSTFLAMLNDPTYSATNTRTWTSFDPSTIFG